MKRPHPFPIGLEIHELARLLKRLYLARAGAEGFTEGQWRTLWHLSRNQGISQAGLAEILEMQPISLARLIDRMEATALVERRPDPKDRRAVQLYLTPAAGPLLERLHALGAELQDSVLKDLTQGEQETLHNLLHKMRQGIESVAVNTAETAAEIAEAS